MKSNRGVTLAALVIYIIVMIIVLGVMSAILNEFYNNTGKLEGSTEEYVQLSHFNTYFLKEVKAIDNKVDNIQDNYIMFSSGNSFSFSNNNIYFNNIMICRNVKSLTIKQGKNGNGADKNIICVQIAFENYSKTINYKVENIY